MLPVGTQQDLSDINYFRTVHFRDFDKAESISRLFY